MNIAIQKNPGIAKNYYLRGTIYKYMKKYDEAITDMNKEVQLDPKDGEGYVRRGIYFLDMGDYKKAIEDIEYGFKLSPKLKDSAGSYLKEAKDKLNKKK